MLPLKEVFNPKAISKLMGHAKELITMGVYADNRDIIADGVPKIEKYMRDVLSNLEEAELFKKELLEIVVDVTEFLLDTEKRTKVRLYIYTKLMIYDKIKKFFLCYFVRMELQKYVQ